MTEKITVGDNGKARAIAVRRREGGTPGFVWLGGFRSDMAGTKAQELDAWCGREGHACCRHDYSGHGESGGEFRDGTISRWLEESLAVFRNFTSGPQILVGSSMGAWIAIRMAQELAVAEEADRLHAILLLAPAPDFTEALLWPNLTEEQRARVRQDGVLEEPSQYSDEPDIYTAELFDDGKRNLVLDKSLDVPCPVHILQGMADPDVPWQHAMTLAECLPSGQVSMTLVKDGDHRLSRPQDIALMLRLAGFLADEQTDSAGSGQV